MPRICHVILMPLVLLATGLLTASLSFADDDGSHYFTVQGVKIHYIIRGEGEPVILIHGLDSSAALNWTLPGITDELARDHKVVALDLPGHGQSDKPDAESAYGRQLVEDVVALMDELKLKKAHIVGYSLGGMIALKFVVDHPDRVLSGTLGGMGWLRDGSRLQKFWELLPAREGGKTPPAFIHTIGQLAVTLDELKHVSTPMRLLVGDRDPCKRLYVEPLVKVRDDWAVVEIKDAGHLNCITKAQFHEELSEWIGKNSK